MAEHFTADTLAEMTGEQVTQEVMDLLRSDKTRGFTIDIETDTTVKPDEAAEQGNAIAFTKASTEFIAGATNATAAQPLLTPMFFEMYKAISRRFKLGRELEEIIDETAESVIAQAQQAAEQPQPDPAAQAAEAEAQAMQQQAQSEIQIDNAKAQAEIQRKNEETQAKIMNMIKELDAKITMKQAESNANDCDSRPTKTRAASMISPIRS